VEVDDSLVRRLAAKSEAKVVRGWGRPSEYCYSEYVFRVQLYFEFWTWVDQSSVGVIKNYSNGD
jgi:hypothetical protein